MGGVVCLKSGAGRAIVDAKLIAKLIERAKRDFDGHLTILRFTTNWRVGFITPDERADIDGLPVGETFEEAANAALAMSRPEHWEKIKRARTELCEMVESWRREDGPTEAAIAPSAWHNGGEP